MAVRFSNSLWLLTRLHALLSNYLEIVISLFHDDCDAKNFGSYFMTIAADRFSHEHVSLPSGGFTAVRL
jgi:hypothetical protein